MNIEDKVGLGLASVGLAVAVAAFVVAPDHPDLGDFTWDAGKNCYVLKGWSETGFVPKPTVLKEEPCETERGPGMCVHYSNGVVEYYTEAEWKHSQEETARIRAEGAPK